MDSIMDKRRKALRMIGFKALECKNHSASVFEKICLPQNIDLSQQNVLDVSIWA